ncbi:hypothetical protein [Actinomadura mexicana]|uniref:Uncharacterized protein n=1 Tax=Actinomadura mexicana TaxID=134959 RepID=A0A239A3W0_9ACTN|nr:hypothetical protein [Actinomadura mexicana]SNR90112.1 hypothetical protein SAMN06265355_108169 [Actinomadura mexicana]
MEETVKIGRPTSGSPLDLATRRRVQRPGTVSQRAVPYGDFSEAQRHATAEEIVEVIDRYADPQECRRHLRRYCRLRVIATHREALEFLDGGHGVKSYIDLRAVATDREALEVLEGGHCVQSYIRLRAVATHEEALEVLDGEKSAFGPYIKLRKNLEHRKALRVARTGVPADAFLEISQVATLEEALEALQGLSEDEHVSGYSAFYRLARGLGATHERIIACVLRFSLNADGAWTYTASDAEMALRWFCESLLIGAGISEEEIEEWEQAMSCPSNPSWCPPGQPSREEVLAWVRMPSH